MTCGIYEIKNETTGEFYIGQSKNIEKRWEAHKSNPAEHLISIINSYKNKTEQVKFRILEEINSEEFNKEELKFVLCCCEKEYLDSFGGITDENNLNIQPIHIPPVSPSILDKKKKNKLPGVINEKHFQKGIERYFRSKERCVVYSKDNKLKYQKQTIKKYNRKNHRPQYQINFGVNCVFDEGEHIVTISEDYFNELMELNTNLKLLQSENNSLKDKTSRDNDVFDELITKQQANDLLELLKIVNKSRDMEFKYLIKNTKIMFILTLFLIFVIILLNLLGVI